jgi:hypothetical protein
MKAALAPRRWFATSVIPTGRSSSENNNASQAPATRTAVQRWPHPARHSRDSLRRAGVPNYHPVGRQPFAESDLHPSDSVAFSASTSLAVSYVVYATTTTTTTLTVALQGIPVFLIAHVAPTTRMEWVSSRTAL